MLVDFQLATASLAGLIQRTVENKLPTLGDLGAPFDFTASVAAGATATPHVIDHVRVDRVIITPNDVVATPIRAGDGRVIATIDRRRPQVELDVRAPLAPLAALEEAGRAGLTPAQLVDVRMRIRFALDVALVSGRAELALTLTEVALGVGVFLLTRQDMIDAGRDPAMLDAITEQLRAVEQRTVIDTSAITSLFSSSFVFWNAGIAVAGASTTIRMQFAAEGDDTNFIALSEATLGWTQFYGAGPRDRRGTNAWGLFISGVAFERLLEQRLRDAFAGMTDTALMPDRPPHARWTVTDGGVPRVTAECGVTSLRACQPLGLDIYGTLRVRLDLSSPRPSVMRLDLHYDSEPYRGEVIGCVALTTFVGGFVGMVIGGTFASIPGAIVGAIIGAVAGLVGSIAGLATRGGGGAPSIGGFTAVPGSSNDFFSEMALVIPGGDVFGSLAFTSLTAAADGLGVGGSFGDVAVDRRARLAIDRVPDAFAWRIDGSCARWSVMAVADLGGRHEGTLAMAVYRPTILDPALRADTASACAAPGSRIDRPRAAVPPGGRVTISTRASQTGVERLQEAAVSPTPPLRLLVATSGGARILHLPGIDATLTAADRERTVENQHLSCASRRLQDQLRALNRRPFPAPHPFVDPVGPAITVLGLESVAR